MVGRDWRLNSVDSRVTCRVNLDGFVISTYNTQTTESVLYRFGSKSAGEVTLCLVVPITQSFRWLCMDYCALNIRLPFTRLKR